MRQYIGARYVPKFMGAWSNTTQYNALEVVDNGSGTSYIARKTVPAGTALTNTEYWFVYGASSGAIIDLQNRMSTAETNITSLQSKIDFINDKKIMLISDSYGIDSYTGGQSWITKVTEMLPSITIKRSVTGGAGFGYDIYNELYFPNVFNDLTADPNVGMVLLLCGANDGNLLQLGQATESNIQNGLVSGIGILKTKFPNADINIGFVGRYKTRDHFTSYKTARNIYKNTCLSEGISFADNFEYVLHNRNLLDSTLVHPTQQGSNLIARYAVQYIAKRNITVHDEAELTGVGANNLKMKVVVHNENTTVTLTDYRDTNLATLDFNKEVAGTSLSATFDYEMPNLLCEPVAYRSRAVSGQWIIGSDSVMISTIAYMLNQNLTMSIVKGYGTHAGTYSQYLCYLPDFTFDSMDC